MRPRSLVQQVFVLLVSSTALTGCAGLSTKTFVYPSSSQRLVKLHISPKRNEVVAVLPFEDLRGTNNRFRGFFIYAVPGVWNGVIRYERPDTALMFNSMLRFKFHAPLDLAEAAAVSLRTSNLFRDVYVALDGDPRHADLMFSGKVRSTRYEGKVYSYGLSIFGPLLWFVGLPTGSSTNELKLELLMRDADIDAPMWRYEFQKAKTITRGMYYNWNNWGRDVGLYSELMEEGMNEAIKDLDKKLPTLVQ